TRQTTSRSFRSSSTEYTPRTHQAPGLCSAATSSEQCPALFSYPCFSFSVPKRLRTFGSSHGNSYLGPCMYKLNLPEYDFMLKRAEGKVWIFDGIRKKYIVLTPE